MSSSEGADRPGCLGGSGAIEAVLSIFACVRGVVRRRSTRYSGPDCESGARVSWRLPGAGPRAPRRRSSSGTVSVSAATTPVSVFRSSRWFIGPVRPTVGRSVRRLRRADRLGQQKSGGRFAGCRPSARLGAAPAVPSKSTPSSSVQRTGASSRVSCSPHVAVLPTRKVLELATGDIALADSLADVPSERAPRSGLAPRLAAPLLRHRSDFLEASSAHRRAPVDQWVRRLRDRLVQAGARTLARVPATGATATGTFTSRQISHDIVPANELGLASVWINRLGGERGPRPTGDCPTYHVPRRCSTELVV